jgi:AraC-like DNA-binding protein/lipoprotein NlpI
LPYLGAAICCGINASWGFVPFEEGMQQAEQFLSKGFLLEEKNRSHLGYFAQATVSFWGKWDFKMGHQYFLQSMQLNPSFTEAEEGLAELYTAIGEFEKAMQHTHHILTLNPLSPNHYYTKGNIHYLSGNYNKAIKSLQSALQIDPQFALAIEMIAACYIHLRDYESLNLFLQNNPQAEQPNACRALYKLMHPDENIDLDIEKIRMNLSSVNSSSLIPWYLYLHIYLGNHELALDLLEAGIKFNTGQFINFKSDPFLVPLYQYERFQNMIQTVFHSTKLPNAEEQGETKVSPSKSVMSKQEAEQYLSAITYMLEKEQLFLDSNLCLKILAEKVKLHPNKLSWLLNEQVGKNFNEYINSYRLVTFKEKAINPDNQHLTLLGLAYESGFNSKTVFNTFFKKMEGMTPRAWVKKQSN